ncbi:Protein kinase C-binding protein NELL2 [Orchesella cincta]|uniref:Protein kinase C-binding protein NELL2 n=1 Tax=Orchesella cincta TaxID=48709 RepID=A0A1D2MS25_ORCCI|nr:Protein kinase C-binding protein NELL2 [Orchesella cincta]
MVSSDWVDRIRAQVSEIGVNDFTISAIIKQNPNNVGTILAFSKGLLSALEIQSSGRKNELRVISGSLVETFPFRLADGSWHRLAITFSASQVDILVDCMPVSRRVLKFDPVTAIFNSLNMSIWIGQKTTSHFLYQKGEILCQPVQCPQAKSCKNPISKPGECCPTCLKQCYFRRETYDHGETISIKECTHCKCTDGTMQCKKHDPEKTCPPLTCPLKDQVIVPGECCKVCLGTDYCASHGHLCHSNATCLNLQTTYTCQCKEGFTGDGVELCEDIDECLLERHHCARNSKCVNTIGGYSCECASGYKKVNQFQCEDENECAVNGSNKCHSHSTCTNTKGSYMCACNPGYTGNGIQCTPICNQTCENGGICIAPDVCSCRAGWDGAKCETDIDECFQERNSSLETGALCPANALCVNKPGWYLCQCMDGFQASLAQSGEAQCIDINECSEDDACPVGLECVNTVGSYECRCSSEDHHCSSGCWNEGRLHPSGSNWFRQDCSICNCESTDNISCSPYSEDLCSQICSPSSLNMTDENPLQCCNKCASPNITTVVSPSISNLKTCQHQLYPNLHFKSG